MPFLLFAFILLIPFSLNAGATGEASKPIKSVATPVKTMDLAVATKSAESWFNTIQSLQADFSQTSRSQGRMGRTQTGEFYLKRPNRFLWQYEMPTKQKIVSTGSNVFFHDDETNQTTQIPRSTPMVKLLNAKTVNFSNDDFKPLSATETAKTFTLRIALMDDDFEEGQFTLTFNKNPRQLSTITMMDALGSTNTIRLSKIKTGMALNNKLFKFTPPQYEEN